MSDEPPPPTPHLYPSGVGMTARQRLDRIRLRLLAQRFMRGAVKVAVKSKGGAPNKYQPHQGAKERARRAKQQARQDAKHVQQTD